MSDGMAGSHKLVEHLFRHEAGHLTASLTRILGVQNLAIAEEIVQETLLKALQVWPYHPPIEQPVAWLRRVARNKAIDHLRHQNHHLNWVNSAARFLPPEQAEPNGWLQFDSEAVISDELLRMIFLCCSPEWPVSIQVALCLNMVGGLSTQEIATAFLTAPETMRKRIYRAKQSLRKAPQPFKLPSDESLPARMESVLAVLYLMFNEGYHSDSGEAFIRRDLCAEAMRLVGLLLNHPRFKQPAVYALAALMSFLAARLNARIDAVGDILLMAAQDRSTWNRKLIAQGFSLLQRAKSSHCDSLTTFHLEAGIAATHCAATDMASVNWAHILELYDQLRTHNASPMVRLNRAIVLGYVHGPDVALCELEALQAEARIKNHYLLLAALGEFALRAGKAKRATSWFRAARDRAPGKAQKRLLAKKLASCALGNIQQ